MTSISINKTYLDICLAVYGIQPNVDNTNAIDREIWEQTVGWVLTQQQKA